MEVGHLLENLYDDCTVRSVAMKTESAQRSYCNKGWYKKIGEPNGTNLDHTNDSIIIQLVQENVALIYEGTHNQTLKNLSVLTALHSRQEGIWHSNGDTWEQIFCLTKQRLQMAKWYTKAVKRWEKPTGWVTHIFNSCPLWCMTWTVHSRMANATASLQRFLGIQYKRFPPQVVKWSTVQTGFRSHPAPIQWLQKTLLPRFKWLGMITGLHIMLRLRITGAIPPLPHAFIWTGTTSTFPNL